ncbi:MAG: response regulator transcription factor [Pseudomonadota bacterium]
MAATAKILLLDEHTALAMVLREQFADRHEFSFAHLQDDAAVAQHVAQGHHVDLIILNEGCERFCAFFQNRGFKGPILYLGEKGESIQTAADWIAKPFRFGVLVARIRAHLHSHAQSEEATLKIGPYTFHPALKLLSAEAEQEIKLTYKEAGILKFLYQAKGTSVSREVLLNEVWEYSAEVTTHTLETHIYRLRQKIEPVKGEITLLLTDEGGYKLAL